MKKPPIPTPEEFAATLENCIWGDTEGGHGRMDGAMEDRLRRLGYGKAMDVFAKAGKWYA